MDKLIRLTIFLLKGLEIFIYKRIRNELEIYLENALFPFDARCLLRQLGFLNLAVRPNPQLAQYFFLRWKL